MLRTLNSSAGCAKRMQFCSSQIPTITRIVNVTCNSSNFNNHDSKVLQLGHKKMTRVTELYAKCKYKMLPQPHREECAKLELSSCVRTNSIDCMHVCAHKSDALVITGIHSSTILPRSIILLQTRFILRGKTNNNHIVHRSGPDAGRECHQGNCGNRWETLADKE